MEAAVVSPRTGVTAHEDQARADEPDAGDDLGRHPGRVGDDKPGLHDIIEAVLADQHE